jgi:hypothetical protein
VEQVKEMHGEDEVTTLYADFVHIQEFSEELAEQILTEFFRSVPDATTTATCTCDRLLLV